MGYLTAVRAFIGGIPAKVMLTLIGIIIAVLFANYVIDLHVDRDTAVRDAATWKKKAEDLGVRIESVDSKQKDREEKFADLDMTNIDLLCMARYEIPPIQIEGPAAIPEVLEVIKYKDRPVPTPAAAAEKSKSDQIGTQALSNSWKAYCIATDNKADICKPYRKE